MISIIMSVFSSSALLTILVYACCTNAFWLTTIILSVLLIADVFWMAVSISKFEIEIYSLKHTANLCKMVALSNDTWRKTFVYSLTKNNSINLAVSAADEAYKSQMNTFTGAKRT